MNPEKDKNDIKKKSFLQNDVNLQDESHSNHVWMTQESWLVTSHHSYNPPNAAETYQLELWTTT